MLTASVAYAHARKQGYFDALHTDIYGNITEGTTFNFAIRVGDTLITPKKNTLDGTTMAKIIYFAKKLKLKVKREPISQKDVSRADEAFITGSIKKVVPVVRVDKQKIGNGKPGEYTKVLMQKFDDYVSGKIK